jgi:dTDP-4-dehydrorhamnose reductase
MKILIIGASGQLGGALMHECLKHSVNVTGTAHRRWCEGLLEADLTDRNSVKEIFSAVRPDMTVFCAGITDPDFCEEHPDDSRLINVGGAEAVAKLCNSFCSRMAYVSCDGVFDGACGPYSEDALASPQSEYGRAKLAAEEVCSKVKAGGLVVRTSGLYGCATDAQNIVAQLLIKSKNRERIIVPSDQFFTPTYVPDLATALLLLILRGETGLFNVAGPELMSQSDFAKMVCERLGLDAGIVDALSTAQLHQPAPRPLKAGLLCDKLYDETGFVMMRCANALSLVRAQLSGIASESKPRRPRRKTDAQQKTQQQDAPPAPPPDAPQAETPEPSAPPTPPMPAAPPPPPMPRPAPPKRPARPAPPPPVLPQIAAPKNPDEGEKL